MRFLFALTLFALSSPSFASDSGSVKWVSWSDDLFRRAAAEKKLVLLDVEAIWCHWCHVMDQKTYTDPRVAKIIAEKFIAVKVDQDGRPDIARRYEDYGWPATIVFDSQGKELAKLTGYQEANEFFALLTKKVANPTPEPDDEASPQVTKAAESPFLTDVQRKKLRAGHEAHYDKKHGGWGKVHKFLFGEPEELAMRDAWRGDKNAEKMARTSLTKALVLIDRVWGGMYQYSVETWKEPHFEKIARTQARDLFLYSLGYAQFKDEAYKKAAVDIRKFLTGFLRDEKSGAYYTSMDADVVKGVHSEAFFKLNDADRRKKGIPSIDKNIYSRENGMFIAALAAFYGATGDETALTDAVRAAEWIGANRSLGGGGFRHGEKESETFFFGDTLEMGRAYLALYEVTGKREWLTKSMGAAKFLTSKFPFKVGGVAAGFAASGGGTGPLAPQPDRQENTVAARYLNALYQYTGEKAFREGAETAMRYLVAPAVVEEWPTAGVLLADRELAEAPVHVTVVGKKDDAAAAALFHAALQFPSNYRRIEWWDKSEGNLLRNDVTYPQLPKAAAFACREGRCSVPLTDPAQLLNKVSALIAKK